MNTQHPITPPPELVEKWIIMFEFHLDAVVLTEVAQWGADQELEACCLWLNGGSKIDYDTAALLRASRRPKPPSLKEQALAVLEEEPEDAKELIVFDTDQVNLIRRALEALPND